MKILGETETIKMDRKLLKPQVERRRRERMNRSLENLRALLLQGPEHNNPTQRRIEKAEILEYTVLFLQNSVAQAKKANDVEAAEKRQFMDGFSSCLQKAARFLSDEGKAHGLEGSVTATLCQRLTQPCVSSTTIRLPVRIQNSSRRPVPDSNVQHHLQQSSLCKQGLPSACRTVVPHANRTAFRSTDSNTLHSTARSTSQHQTPVSQTVWRPWP
ncbi:transcription factor HES- -A-like protein [Labeo rohita]|uniref:Transcription factor HES--A-like protein n=2 Tax=Labeo rohita TaxID=84645 RepID=A0A498NDV4_LABRO|nr:hairy and enhancer of split related-7 [Labeo rohita]XP_050965052.1 hairy and enhancer of split related-7 [Labeo rohita]KAI2664067.1 Transcription factor HES-7.1-A [Labeo rohita]RXN30614.1 transcription factor HES- -A-like protein [Labeo rohita]